MGKPLTNAELAILSLIAEKDMHGYEIETVIRERGMRNWTEIGFSSIYHILGRLERELLIGSRTEAAPGKGPARKIYEARKAGRKRYEAEALGALSSAPRSFSIFMQGLAALPSLDPGKAAEALAAYRGTLADRLAEVRGKNLPGIPFHVAEMFSYSETMILAESSWAAGLEKRLRSKAAKGVKE